MDQLSFHMGDSFAESLGSAAHAVGGVKVVCEALWPTKFLEDPEGTARYFNQCLDPTRREKLSLTEIEQIIMMASNRGVLLPLVYLNRKAHCEDPKPVTPEERRAQLHSIVMQATVTLETAVRDLKDMQRQDEQRKGAA